MYVCGITPYDATHLGHAATYLAFDLVNRMWRDAGHAVRYVQNVTDIDDPLLERAERDGEDWIVLAMRETALFREDMTALRVLPPDDYVGAVESIPRIVEHIDRLLDAGVAYPLDDGTGDVYHDIAAAPGFGQESNYDQATMLRLSAERGGDPDRPGKRNRLDPLLWRGERPGEPSWAGPRGVAGRPGWHVECATIALATIGMDFDVQGGGSDLIFPHHEYSAVHAEALTDPSGTSRVPFARVYAHAAMIGLDGEKMSKSRGNLVFVSRLRGDGVDPMAIRLALLSGHYRTDRAWTPDLLRAAHERLATWRRAGALPAGAPATPVLEQLRERLADDLDSVSALAAVDSWAQATLGQGDGGSELEDGAPALVSAAVDALLGVALQARG
jgi:L-cysteine:1D-myo-inositol 2-amino-2-deoxy-alpha-D-glucopyranoside ligase